MATLRTTVIGGVALALVTTLVVAEATGGEGDDVTPGARTLPTEPAGLMGRRLLALDGTIITVGSRDWTQPTAFVFIGTECPISNRSVPKLNALAKTADAAGAQLIAVISDRFVTAAEARAHMAEYAVEFPVVFDGSGILGAALAPSTVPEAFVVGSDDRIVYRGAIDDGWDAVTKPKPAGAKHSWLADAIQAAATGEEIATPVTDAVGCVWEGERRPEGQPKVSYTRDVAPILATSCMSCHRDGEIAPFTLTSYEDAARRADMIDVVVSNRLMPPWQPKKGHGEFLDESSLHADEVAILEAWAEADAPKGHDDDLPTMPSFPDGWRLGEPDLIIEMDEAYAVKADGPDDFRNFVLPMNLDGDKQVIGFEFKPGAPSVVHHAIAFLDDERRARRLDAQHDGPGYPGFGGIGFNPSGALGGFAPGSPPTLLPDGIARYVKKSADVVLQLHYHPSGKAAKDKSRIGIYFAKNTDNRKLEGIVLGARDIDIPPGEKNYIKTSEMTLPKPVELIGNAPHMHYLGKEMRIWAELPDGEVLELMYIDDWNFRWQGQYLYRESVKLPAGTKLKLWARYDNSKDNADNPSDPPTRVRFGEESFDEMCFDFINVVVEDPAHMEPIRQAMIQAFIGEEMERRARKQKERRERLTGKKTPKPAPETPAPEKKKPAKKKYY